MILKSLYALLRRIPQQIFFGQTCEVCFVALRQDGSKNAWVSNFENFQPRWFDIDVFLQVLGEFNPLKSMNLRWDEAATAK